MTTLDLHLKLLSDATFGRGDGVAGLVDSEVEHDINGLPFLRGRTLKGLLAEECSNILFTLGKHTTLQEAARKLFGNPGSDEASGAIMRVGAAQLPEDLREVIRASIANKNLQPAEVLESLTAIRRQTAVDVATGAPDTGSLRSMRVILRDTVFTATLTFFEKPEEVHLALLAACVKAFRRAGTGRNRGRGRLVAWLQDETYTQQHFEHFKTLVSEVSV